MKVKVISEYRTIWCEYAILLRKGCEVTIANRDGLLYVFLKTAVYCKAPDHTQLCSRPHPIILFPVPTTELTAESLAIDCQREAASSSFAQRLATSAYLVVTLLC